jgi:hypothetical protein
MNHPMTQSHESWLFLSQMRRQFHEDCTNRNLWEVPEVREAYFALERLAESAWVKSKAETTGRTRADVASAMNEVYHSRFD